MKKLTIFRTSLVFVFIVLLLIGGNAKAIEQLLTFLPVVLKNPSPTPTLPPFPTFYTHYNPHGYPSSATKNNWDC